MHRLFCLLLALLAHAAASETVQIRTWTVILDDAIRTPERPAAALRLVLRQGPGGWWPVLGDAPDHNKSLATGSVSSAPGRLRVRVILPGDTWVPGGIGEFELPGDTTGPLEGRWRGSWRGSAGEGALSVALVPAALSAVPSRWQASDPPRLWRDRGRVQAALPLLRQAPAHPLALGLRRLVEQDGTLHELAWPAIEKALGEREAGSGDERGYRWGDRLRLLAVAWDLHRDAMDPGREARLRRWLADYGERALLRPWTISDRSYWAPDGRFAAQLRGAGALASLALAGLGGSAPQPPAPAQRDVLRIASHAAGSGLPTQPLIPGVHPGRWLISGPHEATWEPGAGIRGWSGDAADIPGLRDAPPKTVIADDAKRRGWIDLAAATDRLADRSWLLATVVDVADPMSGRWHLAQMNNQAACWISGVPVPEGSAVHLEAGRHSVVIRTTFGATPNAWDGIRLRPHLVAAPPAELAETLASDLQLHDIAMAIHAAALVQHADCGGAETAWIDRLAMARLHAQAWFDLCLGGGALASEGDAALWGSAAPMLEFEILHRQLFGVGVAAADGGELLLARVAALGIGRDQRALPGFSVDAEPITPAIAARAWAITAPARRPAAAHALLPIAAGDPLAALLTADAAPGTDRPVLGWVAPRRGSVFFRNRHQDGDDILVGITADQAPTAAQNQPEAGAWLLHGLGQAWMTADAGSNSWIRPLEAVIVHADGLGAASANGRLLAHQLDADGGGTALIDLSRTLPTLAGDGYGRGVDLADRLGRLREERLPALPAGTHHTRAMAVAWRPDGVLIALRDRFAGAPGPGTWTLPTRTDAAVTVAERRFAWTLGGAVLRGTLLADGDNLRHDVLTVESQYYQRRRSQQVPGIRFDLATAGEAIVVLQLGRAGGEARIERQGERILVDGAPAFTLREDGGLDRAR